MMTWGYIAGFFDGEGHISRASSDSSSIFRISWRLGIAQTQREVLEKVREFVIAEGVPHASVRESRPHREHWKTCWSLQIENRPGVRIFLSNVMPYLHVKKVLAQDVLRWMILYPDLRSFRIDDRVLCAHGHPLRGRNIYIRPNGRRECRRCHADQEYKHRHSQ